MGFYLASVTSLLESAPNTNLKTVGRSRDGSSRKSSSEQKQTCEKIAREEERKRTIREQRGSHRKPRWRWEDGRKESHRRQQPGMRKARNDRYERNDRKGINKKRKKSAT